MFKKTALLMIAVLVVAAASGCDTYDAGTSSKTPDTQASSNSTSMPADDGSNAVTDAPVSTPAPASDSDSEGAALNGFGDLPVFHYYAGAMSAPKACFTVSEDGSFREEWSQLTPQSETDPETGEDLSTKTMTGTLTPLVKQSDCCYTCQVAASDSNDYPVGETITFLLPGASTDLLPDKRYPSVVTGCKDGRLTNFHMYCELEDAVYVGEK